jgi:hypothetical protein
MVLVAYVRNLELKFFTINLKAMARRSNLLLQRQEIIVTDADEILNDELIRQ